MSPLSSSTRRQVLTWTARLIPAVILVMAAIPKLLAAPDSVALFTTLGVEPWGRLALAPFELLAAGLLVYSPTASWGAGLGLVLMSGAIGAHLTRLGVFYGGDPSLFIMALLTFAGSAVTLWLRRSESGHGS